MIISGSRHKPRPETEEEELRRHFMHPEAFDPDKLKHNELRQADGKVFARIPKIPGRITRRKKKNSNEYYIELITERHYDPASKQPRNNKTIIGTDISWLLPGMMQVNETYYQYFDHEGNLIRPLPGLRPPPDQTRPDTAQTGPIHTKTTQTSTTPITPASITTTTKTDTTQTTKTRQQTHPPTTPDRPEGANPVELRSEEEIFREQKQQLETEKRLIAEEQKALQKERAELAELREQLEDEQMQMIVRVQEREKDHLDLLNQMLSDYREALETQAKRRADKPMSLREIRMINELLSEIQRIFKGTEAEDYLRLAEEPDPTDRDKDQDKTKPKAQTETQTNLTTPQTGTTYGEMVLLLTAYHCTLWSCTTGKLWYKQAPKE